MYLSFNRQLTDIYLIEWYAYLFNLVFFTLNPALDDKLLWRWSSKHVFYVQFFCKWMDYGEISNKEYITIWNA